MKKTCVDCGEAGDETEMCVIQEGHIHEPCARERPQYQYKALPR